jgi:hypothetical protein
MKEKFNKSMENLRKKNQSEFLEIKSFLHQLKNTGRSNFSRLEQVEDRISGLEDKIDTKEKIEIFNERFKICEGMWKISATPEKDQT